MVNAFFNKIVYRSVNYVKTGGLLAVMIMNGGS